MRNVLNRANNILFPVFTEPNVGRQWLLGAEYLHDEFPNNALNLNDTFAAGSFVNSRQSAGTVKDCIGYLFSIQ